MSFIKLGRRNLENVSVLLRPSVHFISSSKGSGVTGSQYVSPVRSPAFKQIIDLETASNNLASSDQDNTSGVHQLKEDDYNRAVAFETARASVAAGETNIASSMEAYLNLIDEAPKDVRYSKQIDAFRFDPPFEFTTSTTVKNVTRNILMPYHQHKYENCGFWYSNYQTLNFFDNTHIPTGSALLYPNIETLNKGRYDLPDSFSINFWINPRYSRSDVNYRAGTILHISSSICVSIVSGSSVDEFGAEDKFKILLQLSQSADIAPSSINLSSPSGAYPRDLIFTSSHYLTKNNWHNVFIAWSNSSNNSTGSLFIDDSETLFHIPSSSLSSSNPNLTPGFLSIGNYYNNSFAQMDGLMSNPPATLEGFTGNGSATADRAASVGPNEFNHPLNAEIHDIRIYNKFLNKRLDKYSDLTSKSPTTTDDMIFYVPVYFYPSSSQREVLATPFQKITSTTNDPFNVQYSFGVGGKMINVENFVLDFVNMEQPRLLGLVPETIATTIQGITADNYTYDTGSNTKRLLTILPNDNGLHIPRYDLLEASVMSASDMFKKSGKATDYSIISLENLIPTSSLFPGLVFTSGSIFDQVAGSSPDNPGVAPGSVLTIAQRTRDVSSNEITIVDISNIYYGSKIHPGTFHLYEENLTGSSGDIKINLKDNSRGGLYRADCATKQADWNNIGTILYEEGMVVIKSPNLPYYGRDKIDMKFRGEQQLHTLVLNVPVEVGEFMSSSNKTYASYPPDSLPHNENLSTIHVTTVNIHDDNFNVIMKAQLAQPITKTEEDEFIIRLKQDF